MTDLSLSEFADKINEMMPVIMRGFMKSEGSEFHKLKMTMPQFFILDILHRSGECRMGDIAKSANVTMAAITGIVDRLVRGGYALRYSDLKDRRIVNIRLTARGTKAIKDMIEYRKKVSIKMFGMMSREERSQYLNILTRIKERIEGRDKVK